MSEVEGIEAAREIAQRHLVEEVQPASEPKLVLMPGVHEYPTCWMFAYNTGTFVTTGEIRHALAGNGPIIVNRRTGAVRSGVSDLPLDDQVDPN